MALQPVRNRLIGSESLARTVVVLGLAAAAATLVTLGFRSLGHPGIGWLVWAAAVVAAGVSLRVRPVVIWVGEGLLLAAWFGANHLWLPMLVVGVVSILAVPPQVLRGMAKQRHIFAILSLSVLFVVLPVLAVVYLLVSRGLPGLTWTFITQAPSNMMRDGGIFPAIVGTIYLVLGTMVFSLPIGVLAAVYLTEYARPGRFTRLVHLAIVNLAGVPSIVYGLFGLGLFVILLNFGVSILSGALTLAILTLPVVITASEEALTSVPYSFREASLALGATRWQTTAKVVLPNAIPGIITGLILGIGRAAGETAPILFTVAAFYLRDLPHSVYDQAMALPYHLYVLSTQVPNAPPKIQWGTALVLLALVLGMNLVAALIRTRFRRARKW
jgi:phosphate transport system permease protein